MKGEGGGYQRKPCRKQRYLPAPTIVAWYVDPLTFTSMASPRARDIGASCITCFVDTIECASSSTHSTKKWRSIFKYFYGYHTVISTSYISLPANIVPFIFLSWRWVGLADTYAIIIPGNWKICKRDQTVRYLKLVSRTSCLAPFHARA